MSSFFRSRLRKAVGLLLGLSLALPMTGCDMIIINDMSWDNVSNPETEQNISDGESAYVPVEYTPYEKTEDDYGTAEELLDSLPKRDYEGTVFFITTPTIEYIDPDHLENTVSRMVYERNRKIEELYNISIITSLQAANTILAETKQAVEADSYYTDLMMIPLYMTGQFRLEGVLANLRSLPFLDLGAPYFNSESVSMTSAGYGTYGVAGYATIDPSAFSAVYFNRDLVEKCGLEMPYSLVMDRQWTWERFFEYTAAVSAYNETSETKLYTVGAQNNASRLADLVFIACGNDYINSASKKVPKITFSPRSAENAVSVTHRILTDPYALVDASSDAIRQFEEGNMLFLTEYLSAIPRLTDAKANWGVLPLPLERENDLYRTLISNNELIFAVPVNHTNAEYASVILSALNAGSYGYLYDEYVNYSLVYHLRDNDSANTLELILDTAAFDFALAFGNSYPAVAAGTYGLIREAAKNNDLASRFDAASAAAERALEKDFNLDY